MRNESLQMLLIAVPTGLLSEAGIHPKDSLSMYAGEGKIIISNDFLRIMYATEIVKIAL